MALPQHYLAALLLPTGRINQFGFAILAILIALANVLVWGAVKQGGSLDSWDWPTYVVFLTIWMMFCVMSRRLHDTGSSGFILVPVLILAVVAFFASLDPDAFGHEFRHNAVGILVIEQGIKFVRALAIAGFMYCIKAAGEDGENAYGPEFGDGPVFGGGSAGNAAAAMDRLHGSQEAQHSYRRISSAEAPRWQERRPRAGFGRR
jgi:uncharacterized membrane protein YhaH (DUF805 family)